MKQIKVLRSCKLLGKERSFGDTIPEADFFSLGANVQSALIGSGTVEVLGSDTNPDQLFEAIQRLQASVDRLGDRISTLEGKRTGTTINSKSKEAEDYEPDKGDTVSFVASDDDGNEYPETGKVTSVLKKKRIARIQTETGDRYEVSFEELSKEG
jgi:hypothetical protein